MAGLYIHIPFCKQACYYCDFHFRTNTSYVDQMVDSICKELEMQKHYIINEPVETIYFGGGTPSLLKTKALKKLLHTLSRNYELLPDIEITLESNPDDLSVEKLSELKSLGINRLSIGIQSFQDKILTYLNRAHNSSVAVKSFENARKIGFDNISIDLIFSIPGQSIDDLNLDLSMATGLNPEHISIYSLTIEDKTVFGNWQKKGKFNSVAEENSVEQFEIIISSLEEKNYEQYEISNFCRDKNYSKHNTSYWKNVSYLGVGPGAHSYNGKSRQFNISNNHKYMKSISDGSISFEIETLDNKAKANEYLLTTLRTKWGCDTNKLNHNFGFNLFDFHSTKINYFENQGLIYKNENFIFLTRKGKFVADEIIADLFFV